MKPKLSVIVNLLDVYRYDPHVGSGLIRPGTNVNVEARGCQVVGTVFNTAEWNDGTPTVFVDPLTVFRSENSDISLTVCVDLPIGTKANKFIVNDKPLSEVCRLNVNDTIDIDVGGVKLEGKVIRTFDECQTAVLVEVKTIEYYNL